MLTRPRLWEGWGWEARPDIGQRPGQLTYQDLFAQFLLPGGGRLPETQSGVVGIVRPLYQQRSVSPFILRPALR